METICQLSHFLLFLLPTCFLSLFDFPSRRKPTPQEGINPFISRLSNLITRQSHVVGVQPMAYPCSCTFNPRLHIFPFVFYTLSILWCFYFGWLMLCSSVSLSRCTGNTEPALRLTLSAVDRKMWVKLFSKSGRLLCTQGHREVMYSYLPYKLYLVIIMFIKCRF